MRSRHGLRILSAGIAVGAFACGHATAALTQLQINYDTSYIATVHFDGNQSVTVYDTAFQATRIGGDALSAGHADPFYTFCLDIDPTLIPTEWWQSGDFPSGNNGNTVPWMANGIYRAASLYDAYVGGVTFGTANGKFEGAALQLAIWDVLYGTAASGQTWDVTADTGFYVTGYDQQVVNRVNQMLNSSANNANLTLTTTFWNATDQNGNPIYNQDLIDIPTGFVPESRAGLAAGLVALSLAATGFRRKAARA